MRWSFYQNIIFNFNKIITVFNFVYNNSDGKDIPYNRHDSVQWQHFAFLQDVVNQQSKSLK